jgi:hypothetical protein
VQDWNDYIHGLWWLMHHSSDPNRRIVACAHYIDDAGSDERSKIAIVGGPVFAQKHFFEFHYEWDRIAATHEVEMPIHMNEFSRPHGRLAKVSDTKRKELFYDLVYLINKHKAYSLTVAVDNPEFQNLFPPQTFRSHLSSTSFAFLWCMVLNHSLVKGHPQLGKIAYMLARSPQNMQMTDCYNFWTSYESVQEKEFAGALAFDSPQTANALQAADLVAWANLRKHLGRAFDKGFEPLELLTRYVESDVKPAIHFHYPVTAKGTKALAEIIGEPVRAKGRRRSLLGLFPEWEGQIGA